jgi:putative transposase
LVLGHHELLGPQKWSYYYLYVILDVFSRYVVGWTVQARETGPIAEQLIAQTLEKQQIARGQLTIHADRGTSMTSKPVAFLLADPGVTKTHNRLYTSTDNPYSEAHFKTLKYRPGFPARFTSIEHARAFARPFFGWYNEQHRHSGIGLMTPSAVHHGHAEQLHAARAQVLDAAYAATPERFINQPPVPPELPTAAWINKPDSQEAEHYIRRPAVSLSLTGPDEHSARSTRPRRRLGARKPHSDTWGRDPPRSAARPAHHR